MIHGSLGTERQPVADPTHLDDCHYYHLEWSIRLLLRDRQLDYLEPIKLDRFAQRAGIVSAGTGLDPQPERHPSDECEAGPPGYVETGERDDRFALWRGQ